MKMFELPMVEIQMFAIEDVITTSDTNTLPDDEL